MEKLTRNFFAFPLSVLIAVSAAIPCFAEEAPLETESAAIEQCSESSKTSARSSDLIPVERNASEINGEMVIVEVFEVNSSLDPNELVKKGFEQGGYFYQKDSIVKTPFTETKEKDVEMKYINDTNTDDMGKNIVTLPYSMRYEVDGYVGTLYLNPQTIALTATEQETKSSTKKQVTTTNMEFDDPSQIPAAYNGLPLKSYSFTDGPYMEDSSIPEYFVCTAVYSRTTSWQEDCAWELSAIYKGSVTFENTANVRYTVTYKGTDIPGGYSVVNGELVRTGISILPILGILLLFAAVGFGIWFLLWAMKHGLISSRRLTVEAQDEETGDYSVIQKVRVNKKNPSFTLDTLKVPASRHFLCKMSAQQAKTLRGKIINVFADGSLVTKHQVQPLNESDEYIFNIDLDVVDSGPSDTFAL